jgi:hypothetical protein
MTNQPTPASQWKRSSSIDTSPHPLDLPSGNTCLMKRPGIQAFITAGLIPNPLMEVIQGMLKDAQGGKSTSADQFAAELTGDPDKLQAAFDLADNVTVDVVVDPVVLPVPPPDVEREADALYVDTIDLDDKMFILQYCMGGTADLDRFRQESDSALGSVPAGESVASSPQPSVGPAL